LSNVKLNNIEKFFKNPFLFCRNEITQGIKTIKTFSSLPFSSGVKQELDSNP